MAYDSYTQSRIFFKVASCFLAMTPDCSPGCLLLFQLLFSMTGQLFRFKLEKEVHYFIWGRGNTNLGHSEVICGPLKDPIWGTPEGGLRRENTWERRNWRNNWSQENSDKVWQSRVNVETSKNLERITELGLSEADTYWLKVMSVECWSRAPSALNMLPKI